MFARYRPPRIERHQKPPTLPAEGETTRTNYRPISSPTLSDRVETTPPAETNTERPKSPRRRAKPI